MNANTLSDRIAGALRTETRSTTIADLIEEARTALAEAEGRKDDAEAVAVDPLAESEAVAEADASLAKIGLEVRRFVNAVEQLEVRHSETIAAEKAAERLARYKAAERERDETAAAIEADYKKALDLLLPLASKIVQSNKEVDAVNGLRPDGKPYLARAETIARGLTNSSNNPSIVGSLKLPNLKDDGWLAWPPHGQYGYMSYV